MSASRDDKMTHRITDSRPRLHEGRLAAGMTGEQVSVFQVYARLWLAAMTQIITRGEFSGEMRNCGSAGVWNCMPAELRDRGIAEFGERKKPAHRVICRLLLVWNGYSFLAEMLVRPVVVHDVDASVGRP